MSIVLGPGESVRGSGDDLKNYFYLIEHHKDWWPRHTIGDDSPLEGSDFIEFGGVPGQHYLVALRVLSMGDVNAVDLAQTLHADVLA